MYLMTGYLKIFVKAICQVSLEGNTLIAEFGYSIYSNEPILAIRLR
jgi:hypothetical protein